MAMNGDIVHVHYICKDEEGDIVDDSANSDEPVCFEVEPLHMIRSQHEDQISACSPCVWSTSTASDARSLIWASA